MGVRASSVTIALLLALGGCTSTVHYAVIAPNTAADNKDSCYRQCQLIHAGQTSRYVACLKNCPEARVVHDSQCGDVEFDRQTFTCSTERNQTFNPLPGLLMIAVGVLMLVLIGTYAQEPS